MQGCPGTFHGAKLSASRQQGCSGKPAQGSPGEPGSAALVSLPCTRSCCEILPWAAVDFGCRLSTSRRAVAEGWAMLSREVALGGREALAVRCRGPGLCRQGWVLLLGCPGCCATAQSRHESAVQGFPLHHHGFQRGAAVADPVRAACGHAGCVTQGIMPRK